MKTSNPLLICLALVAAQLSAAEPFTVLQPAHVGTAECSRCEGTVLPGKLVPATHTAYAIHSDLPEIFNSTGVLYATLPVLPPFETHKDGPLAEPMRTQVNKGFESIDGGFEVFLYHLSQPANGLEPRRVVVYVRNDGGSPIIVDPRQAMEARGRMGAEDGPETRLTRRVLAEEWERQGTVQIPAGQGRIIATGPVVGAAQDGKDTNRTGFFTGIVRATMGVVSGSGKPSATVFVVAIPAVEDAKEHQTLAEGLLTTGARSGESGMDMRIPPPACHVRRVVGVYKNFFWKADHMRLDAEALATSAVTFPMATPELQSADCPQIRQTQDMLLHPPYTRPDTVGNYHAENLALFTFGNSGKVPRTVDLRFNKEDADVGLAWQVVVGSLQTRGEAAILEQPVQTAWAGKARKTEANPDGSRSLLESGGIVIPPGVELSVAVRFMVIGTSSLPYRLVASAR